MDTETAALRAETGLHCPPGCGRCCENPQIEATPLEMLPAALELIQRGEAEYWLAQAGLLSNCAFYEASPTVPGHGRCQMYDWRPSLCRLFGYAAANGKGGEPVLAACSWHEAVMPEILGGVRDAIATGFPIPKFSDWQARIASFDPYWGYQRMPINQALQVALERAGLALAYEQESSASPD
ncbi:YkgJ family cysteine cluster protein [Pseudanabaena sp. FACHB-2040]|nr:YkgJ family cysteine cluster protein [Pseudanabaena sp. FACHB-2040]MBD2259012.1 YkgJ family cysteine cluster protein [Pseudanabaena sp. FACHB-2040]